jgi:hypothetical protein
MKYTAQLHRSPSETHSRAGRNGTQVYFHGSGDDTSPMQQKRGFAKHEGPTLQERAGAKGIGRQHPLHTYAAW